MLQEVTFRGGKLAREGDTGEMVGASLEGPQACWPPNLGAASRQEAAVEGGENSSSNTSSPGAMRMPPLLLALTSEPERLLTSVVSPANEEAESDPAADVLQHETSATREARLERQVLLRGMMRMDFTQSASSVDVELPLPKSLGRSALLVGDTECHCSDSFTGSSGGTLDGLLRRMR